MRTITFYSYKGGVGRTLVVANVSRYLARFGQKVFALDFDLEAPGLHYKFGLDAGRKAGAIRSGLVDYIYDFVTRGEVAEQISPYVAKVETGDSTGSIHLLPAGPAPAADYWRKLARINWHELFYSEGAQGIPFFLELKEKIAAEFQPDYLLIDSRTGITEVGGVATTLLADQIVCLLIHNRENLEGAREVLRSVRRAPRLPSQAAVEVLPVLTRIPDQDEEEETRIAKEVREFLNEEAVELAATLDVQEVLVLHSDPELQLNESLRIGGERNPEDSSLLRDYLHLFARLVPRGIVESYMEPLIRQAVEKEAADPEGARKDIDALVRYSYHPEICRELLRFYRDQRVRQAEALVQPAKLESGQIFSLGVEANSGEVTAPGYLPRLPREVATSRARVLRSREGHWGQDLHDLRRTGWGIVFSETDPWFAAIREALWPLLEHRAVQAGSRHREYLCRPGESAMDFRGRQGAGPGATDPERLPYYLLIVGSPEQIPQEFVYELGVQHGVGRICFDTLDGYHHYARSVIEAEKGEALGRRRVTLFAPSNPRDPVTWDTCRRLAAPLAEALTSAHDWEVETLFHEEATKRKLTSLFAESGPALLFTVSHTLTFPWGDPRQSNLQGAIVCQDWPGPGSGRLSPEVFFSAEDVPSNAQFHGLISIHLGSYTAGATRDDELEHSGGLGRAFLSRLSQRLLGHPGGGALAVIGQFGKAWISDFLDPDEQSRVRLFESTLGLLIAGYPVGAAMDFLSQRRSEVSTDLAALLEKRWLENEVSETTLAQVWAAVKEARTYTLLGDPAVRLPGAQPKRRRVVRAG